MNKKIIRWYNLKNFAKTGAEKGFTLIELLASITILGIILTVFFTVFSNSMIFSSKTENRLTESNLAERVLSDIKNSPNTFSSVSGLSACQTYTDVTNKTPGLTLDTTDNQSYYNKTNNKKYFYRVSLCQESQPTATNLTRIKIEISEKKISSASQTLTEYYGYMKRGQ
jgi:prepilin-type N-terminal cleavage/methylation domain-containing protein